MEYQTLTSRTRKTEYVLAFAKIDTARVDVINKIVDATLEELDEKTSVDNEELIEKEMQTLEYLNEISERIVLAIEENGVLDG